MGMFDRHHRFSRYRGDVGRVGRLMQRARAALARVGLVSPSVVTARTLDMPRTTDLEEAVVDLFLLSRCCRVIGTYWSSFAPIAAAIGTIPISVMHGAQEGPAVMLAPAQGYASVLPPETP